MHNPDNAWSGRLSRRRMLGLSTTALGLAATGLAGCGSVAGAPAAASLTSVVDVTPSRVTAPPAVNVLAANLNQDLDALNFAELRMVSAKWVRGFYPMQNADQGNLAEQAGMRKLMTAIGNGYGTVLNLKFNYDQGLPAVGSAAMNVALARLDKVLALVMGKVDIVAVGNEPFYECGGKIDNLNVFYEAIAQHTINYRQQHGGSGNKTQIYMGALTSLDNIQQGDLPHVNRWLDFVKGNAAIAGTDCHPHVASLSDSQKYFDYIIPRIRHDQKFLATEFSLVKFYKEHLTDAVSDSFADEYKIPRGTAVWQVIGDAIAHHFPQQEWNNLLASCTWFSNNRNIMSDMVAAFRRTGRLAVAGYGITQDSGAVTDWGPDKTPWVVNSIFCPEVTQQNAGGLPGHNVTWLNEFRALQQT